VAFAVGGGSMLPSVFDGNMNAERGPALKENKPFHDMVGRRLAFGTILENCLLGINAMNASMFISMFPNADIPDAIMVKAVYANDSRRTSFIDEEGKERTCFNGAL
jgi:hypothetical protein